MMKKTLLMILVFVFVMPFCFSPVIFGASELNHIIIYESINFKGGHTHIFGSAATLPELNNEVSSFIVVSGRWTFYNGVNFTNEIVGDFPSFGPGQYTDVANWGIPNDSISSAASEDYYGNSMNKANLGDQFGHIILYEDSDFGGAHSHIFGSASPLPELNNEVSSFIIESGCWVLYDIEGYNIPRGVILGPGKYSNVANYDIPNDCISAVSNRPDDADENAALRSHIILFQHENFKGAHNHVFGDAATLPGMNDKATSFVILKGGWYLYKDANYINLLGSFNGGKYSNVANYNMPNDSISSLRSPN